MIQLEPLKKYKILYAQGHVYSYGDTAFFETLESIPVAKHLIQVKEAKTGEIVDLTDILSHPWLNVEEVIAEELV